MKNIVFLFILIVFLTGCQSKNVVIEDKTEQQISTTFNPTKYGYIIKEESIPKTVYYANGSVNSIERVNKLYGIRYGQNQTPLYIDTAYPTYDTKPENFTCIFITNEVLHCTKTALVTAGPLVTVDIYYNFLLNQTKKIIPNPFNSSKKTIRIY